METDFEFAVKGVPPSLFQAVVWVSYRNKYKGKSRRLRKEKELVTA